MGFDGIAAVHIVVDKDTTALGIVSNAVVMTDGSVALVAEGIAEYLGAVEEHEMRGIWREVLRRKRLIAK